MHAESYSFCGILHVKHVCVVSAEWRRRGKQVKMAEGATWHPDLPVSLPQVLATLASSVTALTVSDGDRRRRWRWRRRRSDSYFSIRLNTKQSNQQTHTESESVRFIHLQNSEVPEC